MNAVVDLIVGTRPEAIKLAPLWHALRGRGALAPRVVTTGQHGSLLERALADFDLPVDEALGLPHASDDLSGLVARALDALAVRWSRRRPAAVVVQGDTTSALAGGLAAFQHGLPLAHVEAGLRTGDPLRPFPEEANRRMLATLARWSFAPTARARQNLLDEGIPAASVFEVGNTVVDALRLAQGRLRRLEPIGAPAPLHLERLDGTELALESRFVLCTLHRRESFGAPLARLLGALAELVRRAPGISLLFAVHPNPAVARALATLREHPAGLHAIAPVGYLTMIRLLERAALVITDSGGIQEETTALGCPTLVARDVTERPEAVEAGVAELVGASGERLVARALERLRRAPERLAPSTAFGDGHAAGRIAEVLERALAHVAPEALAVGASA